MNFWEQMELTGKELHIEALQCISDYHKTLRHALELCIGNTWRITKIVEQSTTNYDASLATRTADNPHYIKMLTVATFKVEARENGALDKIVEGVKVSIPRRALHFTAELIGNGHLRIIESTLILPNRGQE